MKKEFKNGNDIITIEITDTDYESHNDNLEYLSIQINGKNVFDYDDEDIEDKKTDEFDYNKAILICDNNDIELDDFSIDDYYELITFFEWSIYFFEGEYFMFWESMSGGNISKLKVI
jgi:hypothetical protein